MVRQADQGQSAWLCTGEVLPHYFYSAFEEVTKKTDKGMVVDVGSLSFSKAFDMILHCKLVQKVKAQGELLIASIKRLGREDGAEGCFSEWKSVGSGILQRLVLISCCWEWCECRRYDY